MYGLEMVKASSKLKRGTIYVTLGRMAEKGYVASRQQRAPGRSGLPRRLFRITNLGRQVLDTWNKLEQRLDATQPEGKLEGDAPSKPVATQWPRAHHSDAAGLDPSERARRRLNRLVDRMETGAMSRRTFLRAATALGVLSSGIGSFVDPRDAQALGDASVTQDDLRRSGLLIRVRQVSIEHGNAIEGVLRPNAVRFWQRVYAGDLHHRTVSGRGIIDVEGQIHRVGEGDRLTIPMGQRFAYRPDSDQPWRFEATHPFWQPAEFTYGYEGAELGGDEVWFEIKRSVSDPTRRPALRLIPATERFNYTVVAIDPGAETLGIRSPRGRMIITPITGDVALRHGPDRKSAVTQALSRGSLARVPPGAQFTIRNGGSTPALVEMRPDPPRMWDPETLYWEAGKGKEVRGDEIWFELVLPT